MLSSKPLWGELQFSTMLTMKLVVAAVFCVAFAASKACAKPTRSECIAAFQLDWSSVQSNQADVLNALEWPRGTARIKPLTAMAVSPDRRHLYLQFLENCERKWEMADALFLHWHSLRLDLPKFERVKTPVVPSPWTIDVKGSHWSDGS
jgi:hypothetical protein